MIKNILVAFDGSEAATRALEMALDLAQKYAAKVSILSVAQFPEPAADVETEAILESMTNHLSKDFERIQARAREAGVTLTTDVVAGHPAEQIVHRAAGERSDLIVMGHRGLSRMKEWLLGSVSKRVLSYAPCSVLIVR